MTAAEREGVLAMQVEVGCLASLLRCVRHASETGQSASLVESALSSCKDVATGIADRMDSIPGLYPRDGEGR